MENKISTSIQYQYTNVKLFNEIFYNWKEFDSYLKRGPEVMKEYLLSNWNETREQLKNNQKLLVKDLDKNVTKDDFNITINRTKTGTFIYFLTFPDYEYRDAASKYVALALTPKLPKFITLEYSNDSFKNELCFVIGEFYIDLDTKKVEHKNYGKVDNNRLSWFAGTVIKILEEEGF